MKRRSLLWAGAAGAAGVAGAGVLAACGGGGDNDKPPRNAYAQTNLAASAADATAFNPALPATERDEEFINAWGIAIRPAGAGGHFWVTAGGWSYQFVGDVRASSDASLRSLFQDALTLVRIPGAGVPEGETEVSNTEKFVGFATGTVFNGAPLDSNKFVVRGQSVVVDGAVQTLEGSARFIFCTDSGVISGWTERNPQSGAIVRRNGAAVATVDRRVQGEQYFGLAIKPDSWDRLWAADFGVQPQIRAFAADWLPVALGTAFANPFISGKARAEPGDYVPFNIQVLQRAGQSIAVVAYAKSQPDPQDPTKFFAGEEDAIAAADETLTPDRGRVAVFDLEGRLLLTLNDDKRLNAPWGLAIAPPNFSSFGPFSNALLVGNFGGHGRIAAYDLDRNTFLGFLAQPSGKLVEIEGLWGLQFGNGASLGDANALYFAAGPGDETRGLFGVLHWSAAVGA